MTEPGGSNEAGAPSGAAVVWDKGGEGLVVSLDGEVVRVLSSIPSPPGSRLDGSLVAPPGGPLRVKIHGSKKQPDGRYELSGRLLDLTRDARLRLAALIAPAAG